MNLATATPDDLSTVTSWATVIAAVLALVAIIIAIFESIANSRRVVRERAREHRLRTLMELLDIVLDRDKMENSFRREQAAHARLRLLPNEGLDITRRRFSLDHGSIQSMLKDYNLTGSAAVRLVEGGPNAGAGRVNADVWVFPNDLTVKDKMFDEITDAISAELVAKK